MSGKNSIEETAATVDEAIQKALEQLGADQDDVTIEILKTARSGVLGLGAREARVRVTRRPPEAARSEAQSPPPAPPRREPARPPAPAAQPPPAPTAPAAPAPRRERERGRDGDRERGRGRGRGRGRERDRNGERGRERPAPSPQAPAPSASTARAPSGETAAPAPDTRAPADRESQTREAIAVTGRILELMGEQCEVVEGHGDPEAIELNIKGDGSGVLIGRHGQTLDALEYLVNRVFARRIKEPIAVALDTESYRARRRDQIHRMALSMGEQAKREHETVKLDPMAPRDRRIVHLALKDDPLITTRSTGEGFMRTIEIVPAGPPRPRGPREREREGAIGEQGGFKHGQKKII